MHQFHHIDDGRSFILEPYLIPEVGFGELAETVRDAMGVISSVSRTASYQLPCGCVINSPAHCNGGVCPFCRFELQQSMLVHGIELSPDELDWGAVICGQPEHWIRCSYPFCQGGGTCWKHQANARDGNPYCVVHHPEIELQIRVAEIRESHGFIAAQTYKAWKRLITRGR